MKRKSNNYSYEKSHEVQLIHYRQRQQRYAQNPVLCLYCNKNLPYDKRHNKFCSTSCSASYNNKGVIRNYVNGRWAKKICIHCGRQNTNPKYCSAKCKVGYEWNQKKQKIEETQSVETVSQARRYVREVQGVVCKICGHTEWMGKAIPLTLDHIDGNSDNWKLDNLRLICPNCDAQTPTYKGKNRGNGRHYRRQRYAEGKSY